MADQGSPVKQEQDDCIQVRRVQVEGEIFVSLHDLIAVCVLASETIAEPKMTAVAAALHKLN